VNRDRTVLSWRHEFHVPLLRRDPCGANLGNATTVPIPVSAIPPARMQRRHPSRGYRCPLPRAEEGVAHVPADNVDFRPEPVGDAADRPEKRVCERDMLFGPVITSKTTAG